VYARSDRGEREREREREKEFEDILKFQYSNQLSKQLRFPYMNPRKELLKANGFDLNRDFERVKIQMKKEKETNDDDELSQTQNQE